ncbi:MAG: enoyl-CoA hydratase [Planctomycetes bacterium RBG_16_64_10]|nr:MAG: enoyl-CoA hydratase [Planctomycetes bacterium RBG_16_64_10]
MPQVSIRVQIHGCAGTIILNQPDRCNALTRAMLAELQQALGDLQYEKRVRAMILTGAGSTFSIGIDLDQMHETAQLDDALTQWGKEAEAYRDVVLAMLQSPKPIIAAVNGPAIGGGAGLVLASDIVVGSEPARFGLPEPRHGIVAGIVAPLLVFRVGGGHAARLLLTSTVIQADEAEAIGLYHEQVASDKVWARAVELANECAAGAPEAVQLTKQILSETIGEHLATQLAAGAAFSAAARTTWAAAEGRNAHREKRQPKWD